MKALQAMILGLGLMALGASAQVTTDAPSKPEPPKKAETPKKAAPAKKPEPPKKPQPPKKPEPPKKSELPKSTDPNVRYFRPGDKDAPKLKDKDGNVIPTNPEAYDVSSATRK